MARHFSFDSSEPDWWLEGGALPEGWTVTGDLMLHGPDDHWVGIHFREGTPAADLIGIVNGNVTDAVAVPPSPV